MEVADIAIAPLKEFMKDSVRLVKKCTKPDRREFTLIASKTAFGKWCTRLLHFYIHFSFRSERIFISLSFADCCVFSLSYSLSFTGFIMFGFVGFFVKLVLWVFTFSLSLLFSLRVPGGIHARRCCPFRLNCTFETPSPKRSEKGWFLRFPLCEEVVYRVLTNVPLVSSSLINSIPINNIILSS